MKIIDAINQAREISKSEYVSASIDVTDTIKREMTIECAIYIQLSNDIENLHGKFFKGESFDECLSKIKLHFSPQRESLDDKEDKI